MLIGLFGTGRNGSTLLQRILDGLQDTFVHPVEGIFISAFNDLLSSGRASRLTRQNSTCKPLTRLSGKLDIQLLNTFYSNSLSVLYNEYLKKCEKTSKISSITLKDLLKKPEYDVTEFIPDYLKATGKYVRPDIEFKHYLFKCSETPYINDYAKLFPDMRFIHILRHPVSMCSSQKRSLMENKRLPAVYLEWDWLVCMLDKRWIPHAKNILLNKQNPRHITVLYETLVRDPIGEVNRVVNWLGLNPPPQPDTQTLFYNLDVASFGFNPSKRGIKMPNKAIPDLQKKYNYVEVLTQREIDLINLKTEQYLSEFGYEKTSDCNRRKLITSFLSIDKWELLNCTTFKWKLKALFGMLYRRAYVLRK